MKPETASAPVIDVDALAIKVAAASAKAERLAKIKAAGFLEVATTFIRTNSAECPLANIYRDTLGLVAPEDRIDFPKGSMIREGSAIRLPIGAAIPDSNFREATAEEAASLVTVNDALAYAAALAPIARAETGLEGAKARTSKAEADAEKARKAVAVAEAAIVQGLEEQKIAEQYLERGRGALVAYVAKTGRTAGELKAALASIAPGAPAPIGRSKAHVAPGSFQGANGTELAETRAI